MGQDAEFPLTSSVCWFGRSALKPLSFVYRLQNFGLRFREADCRGVALVGCRLVEASASLSCLILREVARYRPNTCKMAAPPSAYKDRQFLAVIGDEVSSFIAPT